MTKFEFLNTLKTALHGLPADQVEHIVADYERRFEHGMASSGSEAEVAHALGDPWDIAARTRVPTHERAANGAAKAGRVFISGLGLAVFNLFMIIPAFLYGIMLMALYVAALACYFGGIVMTAGSLAGVDELAFRVPFEQIANIAPAELHDGRGSRLHLTINDSGIQVEHEEEGVAQAASASTSSPSRSVLDEPDGGRGLQAVRAIGLTIGGIFLLLLCGVITKYTWIGLKRYVQMNISALQEA